MPSRLKGPEGYSRGNNFEVKGRKYVMNITRSPIDNAVWSGCLNTPFEISVVELFSTDVGLRTALFWAVTQRVVFIPSRHFGTAYRSRLSGVKNQRFLTLDEGTDTFPRNVGKVLPLRAA